MPLVRYGMQDKGSKSVTLKLLFWWHSTGTTQGKKHINNNM